MYESRQEWYDRGQPRIIEDPGIWWDMAVDLVRAMPVFGTISDATSIVANLASSFRP